MPRSSSGSVLEGGSPNRGAPTDLSTEQLLAGTFSTAKLVAAARVLRAAGWSPDRIRRRVFSPFIVVGPASWSDSWGAPRYGPGPIVRTHEGQDVSCRLGADVLAPEDGTIEFDTSLLGGRVARLFRPAGGYFYFAHLTEWNDRSFTSGDPIHRGEVIGSCGATGNATAPHVHFGWYGPDGVAIDPMRRLLAWLHEAERGLVPILAAASIDPEDEATQVSPSVSPAVDALPGGLRDRSTIEATLVAGRPSSNGPGRALDLTPVLLFALLFGMTGRRSAREPTRSQGSCAERAPSLGPEWRDRRGPLLS